MKSQKWFFSISTLLLFTGSSLHAQVVPDGTLGNSGALAGPDYQIEANLGQQQGGNLFHSFQDFNLQSHESATFSGPPTITHVISRVTGGHPSTLDGTIRSTLPHADLYFLNPYGIMFGPHAKLDVPGGFHASTADYLRLSDGGRFDARTPNNSFLTVAPVAAFGFLTSTPAPITLQDSRLTVPERHSLSLIGGNLSLSGQLVLDDTGKPQFNLFKSPLAPLSIPVYTSQLTAPAGQINLASVATVGEVNWIHSHLDPITPRLGGTILLDKTDLNVNGPGGGNIFIRAGLLKLTNSHLESQTLDDQNGGVIDVNADDFWMRGGENYAGIHGNTWGAGGGSTIQLQARQMDFAEGVFITANTYHFGNPGNIEVLTEGTLNFDGQYLSNLKLPSGIANTILSLQPDLDQANPATLEIQAGSLNLLNGAEIVSVTFGVKDSAHIHVQVQDNLTIAGEIREDDNAFGSTSFTFPSGIISNSYIGSGMQVHLGIDYSKAGHSGHLQIQAGKIDMDDNSLISSETHGLGNSGNIDLHSQQLSVTDGSTISTSTYGQGQGGKLQVTVADQIHLSGTHQLTTPSEIGNETYRPTGLQAAAFTGRSGVNGGHGGAMEVTTKHLIIEDLAQINVISETNSHAGNLHLKVDKLEIRTSIIASSTLTGSGNGGEISIQAHEITLSDSGLINSSGLSTNGGKAGNILINCDSLSLLSGGNISISTLGTGPPGKISIKVAGNLLLSGQAEQNPPLVYHIVGKKLVTSTLSNPTDLIDASRIDAAVISNGMANAGDIDIQAGRLVIRDGAEINSAHQGAGDAGDILIQAQEIRLENGALTTETKGGGGGNIQLELSNRLYLIEGKITTSVGTGQGHGGEVVVVQPKFTVLNHSQIKAQADEGQGGEIRIMADRFIASSDSLISASAKRGIDGKVVIAAPYENIGENLQGLPPRLITAVMLKKPCEFTNFEAFLHRSRVYIFQLAGSPQVPGDWHPSPPLSAHEWRLEPMKEPSSSPVTKGKEATGAVVIAMECRKRNER